ncbi:MAG: phage holin family protein [Myxococcales bacterium]|jgi:putative membrane protein
MLDLLVSWLVSSAAIWITAEVLPGFTVKGFKGALIVSAVLGLLQALLGWVLFVAIGIGTLGLGFLLGFVTRLVVMALLLVLTDKLASSLKIRDFTTALLGALVITLLTSAARYVLG